MKYHLITSMWIETTTSSSADNSNLNGLQEQLKKQDLIKAEKDYKPNFLFPLFSITPNQWI